MIQFKLTFDKDMEEDWLNDWCQRGWAFKRFCMGFFNFIPCHPGEFIYRIDLVPGTGLRCDDYWGYVSFMKEMGVEVLQRWGRWVYLRKRTEDGPFDVYTDLDSQIGLYQRMRRLFVWVLILEVFCAIPSLCLLIMEPSLFLRCVGGVFLLIVYAFGRAIRRCGQKIQDLERRRQ
ncbi:MAG: DUF2812 domain-containing protein [Oscillospiraceae bacterium]|jgi:hypothetical protein|nr:DUF2812 domain-containing protein [Oscillospiraceae bacterium]MCI9678016.1 DUF2812 domain-containing protein [Oscillospiraceae bacterium]